MHSLVQSATPLPSSPCRFGFIASQHQWVLHMDEIEQVGGGAASTRWECCS